MTHLSQAGCGGWEVNSLMLLSPWALSFSESPVGTPGPARKENPGSRVESEPAWRSEMEHGACLALQATALEQGIEGHTP